MSLLVETLFILCAVSYHTTTEIEHKWKHVIKQIELFHVSGLKLSLLGNMCHLQLKFINISHRTVRAAYFPVPDMTRYMHVFVMKLKETGWLLAKYHSTPVIKGLTFACFSTFSGEIESHSEELRDRFYTMTHRQHDRYFLLTRYPGTFARKEIVIFWYTFHRIMI